MFEDRAGVGGPTSLPHVPEQRDPAEPSRDVARLRDLLTGLAAVDPVELPAALALVDTRELLAAQAQLDAVLLRRLGDVDARKLHQLDASPTTTSWVRAQGATVAPRPSRWPGGSSGCRGWTTRSAPGCCPRTPLPGSRPR